MGNELNFLYLKTIRMNDLLERQTKHLKIRTTKNSNTPKGAHKILKANERQDQKIKMY